MIRFFLPFSMLLTAWLAVGGNAPALDAAATWALPAQDPVEFNRLSSDQRQLAEQVRRLEKILLTLEQREQEDGNESKVELLKNARLKLADVGDERPLATVLEEIASDLSELRAGNALEQQAELIAILQELLDYLLETEREEQVQSLLEEAKRREAELRALADAQAKLRQQTEDLEAKERESGQTFDQERQALAEKQARLNQMMSEMAEAQEGQSGAEQAEEAAEAGEDAKEDLLGEGEQTGEQSEPSEGEEGESSESPDGEQSESQQGEQSDSQQGEQSDSQGEQSEPQQGEQSKPQQGEQSESQQSEQSESQQGEQSESQQGEQQPGQQSESQQGEQSPQQQDASSEPRSPQDLKEAQQHQKEAEEKLKEAADQAKAEAEQLEDMQELEALINVLEKAEELAERHRQVVDDLHGLVESMDGASRVPRSARVQLRQWAGLEKQIGDEANDLLFEIREHGADTFPFLLRAIVEDHASLAKRIGPPRYRASADAVELAAGLSADWQRLIDAIRIEMERLRKKAEQQPPQDGEP